MDDLEIKAVDGMSACSFGTCISCDNSRIEVLYSDLGGEA